MTNNILKKIAFTLAAWGIFAAVFNFLCGFIARDQYMKLDMINRGTAQKSHGYFAPNQSKLMLFPGLPPYRVTINQMGMRTTGPNPSVENLQQYSQRILCIGDSFTFGNFIDDEASYPFQLQKALGASRDHTIVLNAGVGNTGIVDHYEFLERKGLSLSPDLVILSFYGNDLDDLSREKPYYLELQESPVKSFEQIFKETKFYRSILRLYVDYKYSRWIHKVDDPRVQDILKSRKKGLEDSLYVSKEYHSWEAVKDPASDALKPQWEEYFAYLKKTSDLLKANNIDFIFIINPELISVFDLTKGKHEDILKAFLKENGVAHIDMISVFKNEENVLQYYNDPPRDFHLNRQGNALVVQEILKRISKN